MVQSGVLDVRVELQAAFEETLVVVATRKEQSLISAPASVSVIGSRDIEASAADSVPAMLAAVSGINAVTFSSREMQINARSSTGVLSN